jgi:hypothetical protein
MKNDRAGSAILFRKSPIQITHPMNLSPAFADLAGIAKIYCQDEENAAQLARVAAELISENPALIIGDDIMLSIEEFISYLAQEKKRSELATWRASRPTKNPS